jgi:hypothetical protein
MMAEAHEGPQGTRRSRCALKLRCSLQIRSAARSSLSEETEDHRQSPIPDLCILLRQHLVAGLQFEDDLALGFEPPGQVQNLLLCLRHLARAYRP